MSDEFIWIVTEDSTETIAGAGQKGIVEAVQNRMTAFKSVKLSAADLEQKMSSFLRAIARLFEQAEQQAEMEQQAGKPSGMRLSEAELSVEISAEGEVSLVAGAKAAGKGAIKLKFTRVDKA
jgi:hypothetical protein